jgi:hypothetical protein
MKMFIFGADSVGAVLARDKSDAVQRRITVPVSRASTAPTGNAFGANIAGETP